MKKEFEVGSLDQNDAVAASILASFENYKVFLFEGDLGAGKTTFTQSFCKHLGVKDEVTSPTYTIINEYVSTSGSSVFHADMYRIKDLGEAIETGIEDYLYSGNYFFIEWPQLLTPILPYKFVKLEIRNQSGKRKIIAESYG